MLRHLPWAISILMIGCGADPRPVDDDDGWESSEEGTGSEGAGAHGAHEGSSSNAGSGAGDASGSSGSGESRTGTGSTGNGPGSTAATTTTSGGGGVDHPECYDFAETFCGCLGDAATDDCYETYLDNCDLGLDICPGPYAEHVACVESQNCAPGWLSTCTIDSGNC